jgi:hypothetical protein
VTENGQEAPTFPLPDVSPLPFFERPVGRLLSVVLGFALLAVLAYIIRACKPVSETLTVVVAAGDLHPYQHFEANELKLEEKSGLDETKAFTDVTPLLSQAVLVREVEEGQVLTRERVVTFEPSVALTGTVALALPLPAAARAGLQPGSEVLLIGTLVGEGMSADIYTAVVPLLDLTEDAAVIAVSPQDAEQVSLYLPPRGQVVLASRVDR